MDVLHYCRDKVTGQRPWFKLTSVFALPETRTPILILYAWLSEVMPIVHEIEEESVADRKLAWWADEVQRAYQGQAKHPVLQAWIAQGLQQRVSQTSLWQMLQALQGCLQQRPLDTQQALEQQAYAVGGVAAKLEAAIVNPESNEDNLWQVLGARDYLADYLLRIKTTMRWLPLDMQARYQLNATLLQEPQAVPQWAEFVSDFVAWANGLNSRSQGSSSALNSSAHRHFFAQAGLKRAYLRKAQAAPGDLWSGRLRLNQWTQLWCVWQAARRSSRV